MVLLIYIWYSLKLNVKQIIAYDNCHNTHFVFKSFLLWAVKYNPMKKLTNSRQ